MSRAIRKDWFAIITECRNSGLSDHQWCNHNNVPYSTFYYHVRRLRQQACELPASQNKCTIPVMQEVVPLMFEESTESFLQSVEQDANVSRNSDIAISLEVDQITLHITNSANASVIRYTLEALHNL